MKAFDTVDYPLGFGTKFASAGLRIQVAAGIEPESDKHVPMAAHLEERDSS
jgi:hypothetical protein